MVEQYLWMVIVGGIACFTMGFGIGANDVANNIGSAIGSGALSFRKAVGLAAFFELVGAVGLGASVTDSVKGGIIVASAAQQRPDLVMWSNLAALLTGTVWLVGCSMVGLPVSTTHTTIGCLFGAGMAIPNGSEIINWSYLGTVVASWFISPLLCMILTAIVFTTYRKFVLRVEGQKGLKIAKNTLGATMFLTLSVFGVFFMVKTPATKSWAKANIGLAIGAGFGIGLGSSLIITPIALKFAGKKMKKSEQLSEACRQEPKASVTNSLESGEAFVSIENAEGFVENNESDACKKCGFDSKQDAALDLLSSDEEVVDCNEKIRRKWYSLPWFMDIQAAALGDDKFAREQHDSAEKFDPNVEQFFSVLQIITASLACIVHGANDVANSTAPFSGIYGIYESDGYAAEVATPYWILATGGAAIGIGVFFLGHKVIMSMGFKLAAITPARGFCMELGSTMIMVVGSFAGIPLSTTHCKVGGTMAIAMLEPSEKKTKWNLNGRITPSALNGRLVLKIIASWVGTLLVAGAMSALVFSLGVYSPGL